MSFILRKHVLLSHTFLLRLQAKAAVPQSFHTFRPWLASEAEFDAAKTRLNSLKEDPGNEVKLKLYALFKQASDGECTKPKPGGFDFVGKAKWIAWNGLGSMTKEDARQKYVNTIEGLISAEGGETAASESTEASSSAAEKTFNTIIYEVIGKTARITLNRPNTKNAFSREMFYEVPAALRKANEDKNVTIAVITGTGNYYSSGNDLNSFTGIEPDQMQAAAEEGSAMLEQFVNGFIDFTKPLIAAVNGPAIGVACTTLSLCDVVYASDTAIFYTPFPSLGQSPEGCSSYTFPKIMGAAKANEMLLFGRKLTAMEAKERCLVTDVFAESSFQSEVNRRTEEYSQLPPLSTVACKNLIQEREKDFLKKVNKTECSLLVKLWQSQECFDAVMDFLSKNK